MGYTEIREIIMGSGNKVEICQDRNSDIPTWEICDHLVVGKGFVGWINITTLKVVNRRKRCNDNPIVILSLLGESLFY